MIHKDEEGNIISVDSLSEIIDEMNSFEKKLKRIIKKGVDDYTPEEKAELSSEVKQLKTLLTIAQDKMKEVKNPLEVVSFVKQVLKFKNLAEQISEINKEENIND